jgi:hypothetical protein
MAPKPGKASAVLWVYRSRFILPFRPLSSPMPRLATVAKLRVARHMGEAVRRGPTGAVLPNVGRSLNEFLAVAASRPTPSLRRSDVWHFEGQRSWTW